MKPKKSKKSQPKSTPASVRKRLEGKLLSLGGSKVFCRGKDPEAKLIADKGCLFTQRVRMRRGAPHRCHGNAADLWAHGIDKYQLVTGYTWVIGGKTLYETTHRFDRYFGVVLGKFQALYYWMANCFTSDRAVWNAPRKFWNDRPGTLDLCVQVTRSSEAERTRLLEG
jgi:hypothetical protein